MTKGRWPRKGGPRSCVYPGHNGMAEHDAAVLMSSPGDRLGRHRVVACCVDAALFAKQRGYVQVGFCL